MIGEEKGDQARLTAELLSLRKGRGASPGRLAKMPALLEALGTTDPNAAHERLVTVLDALGEGIEAQALRNAYGVGFSRERTLTRRRQDFGTVNVKHPDTVEAYENEMVGELLIRLQAPPPNPHILVVGYIVDGSKTSMMHQVTGAGDLSVLNESTAYNASPLDTSLPLAVHFVPTWAPYERLVLTVAFSSPPPKQVFAQTSPDLFSLVTWQGEVQELELEPSEETELVALPINQFESPPLVAQARAEFAAQPGTYYSLHWLSPRQPDLRLLD